MTNDKIILDNVEYKKMIEDLEAFKREREKRLLCSKKYYKELSEEAKEQRKLKLKNYIFTEEQKEKRKLNNMNAYYKKMTSDEERQKIRDRAREYYQKKIKTDTEKYNKIKESQKIKYHQHKQEKKEPPREFVNLEIAAY